MSMTQHDDGSEKKNHNLAKAKVGGRGGVFSWTVLFILLAAVIIKFVPGVASYFTPSYRYTQLGDYLSEHLNQNGNQTRWLNLGYWAHGGREKYPEAAELLARMAVEEKLKNISGTYISPGSGCVDKKHFVGYVELVLGCMS